jgi:hypothetical protein
MWHVQNCPTELGIGHEDLIRGVREPMIDEGPDAIEINIMPMG